METRLRCLKHSLSELRVYSCVTTTPGSDISTKIII